MTKTCVCPIQRRRKYKVCVKHLGVVAVFLSDELFALSGGIVCVLHTYYRGGKVCVRLRGYRIPRVPLKGCHSSRPTDGRSTVPGVCNCRGATIPRGHLKGLDGRRIVSLYLLEVSPVWTARRVWTVGCCGVRVPKWVCKPTVSVRDTKGVSLNGTWACVFCVLKWACIKVGLPVLCFCTSTGHLRRA